MQIHFLKHGNKKLIDPIQRHGIKNSHRNFMSVIAGSEVSSTQFTQATLYSIMSVQDRPAWTLAKHFCFCLTTFPTKAVNFTLKFVAQTLSQEACECFCAAVG